MTIVGLTDKEMVYTGYFAKLNFYKSNGLTPVSIARYIPKWYIGNQFLTVAPEKELLNAYKFGIIGKYEYKFHYLTYLEMMRLVIPVHRITEMIESFGTNVVLLCYEKPSDFCHRHLFRDWINSYYNGFCKGEYYG